MQNIINPKDIAGQKVVKAGNWRTFNALTVYLWSNPLMFNGQRSGAV